MAENAPPISILVAVSNSILSESLCQLLSHRQPNYHCFTDFQKNIATPELVLFDPTKMLEPLQAKYPTAKYILLDSGLKEQEICYLLFYHKVSGVIPPNTSIELFLKALSVVHSGQIWIDNKHLKSLLQSNGAISKMGRIKSLSRQDFQITEMVAQGLKNREIAARLCLSEHTIKAHLSRIFKMLNISRRTQLVSLVLEGGQSKILN